MTSLAVNNFCSKLRTTFLLIYKSFLEGGFLYQPSWGNAVAWSAARQSLWTSSSIPATPLIYEGLLSDEGGVWNSSVVTCPSHGIYLVSFSVSRYIQEIQQV